MAAFGLNLRLKDFGPLSVATNELPAHLLHWTTQQSHRPLAVCAFHESESDSSELSQKNSVGEAPSDGPDTRLSLPAARLLSTDSLFLEGTADILLNSEAVEPYPSGPIGWRHRHAPEFPRYQLVEGPAC